MSGSPRAVPGRRLCERAAPIEREASARDEAPSEPSLRDEPASGPRLRPALPLGGGPTHRPALLGLFALLLAGTGCAERDGLLDLQVEAPTGSLPEGRPYMLVQVRDAAEFPLEEGEEWAIDPAPAGQDVVFDLRSASETGVSVYAAEPLDQLNLKVRFCACPRCDASAVDEEPGCRPAEDTEALAPGAWWSLASPLYPGRRTRFSARITTPPGTPPTTTPVDRCEIECADVAVSGSSNCLTDGTHFCE